MSRPTKILFLYTELAGYFLAGVRHLTTNYPVEAHVVNYPVNAEAPFEFDFPDQLDRYERNSLNDKQLLELAKEISPDLVYCCGWVDKGYLKVCRYFKPRIPVLLTLDNHWSGSPKQRLATLLSPWMIRDKFSHAFVPGLFQYEFARRLGFPRQQIMTGLYAADHRLFSDQYTRHKAAVDRPIPKRLLYVGRYNRSKGLTELWEAFLALARAGNAGSWELWCAGTGDLKADFPDHEQIKDLGFLQPEQLIKVIADTSVLVLPSQFEPWGVVVHEFAAAGFPLILSDAVGAATAFLRSGYNGFQFPAGHQQALQEALHKMISLPEEEFRSMQRRSHELAKQINPDTWACALLQLTG